MQTPRRLAARLLFWMGRAADRTAKATHYLASGTLRLRDLQDGMRDAWQDHYRGGAEHTSGLMPWEQDLVDRYVTTDADVLVIGCGSGRDLLALAERGCRVTGVEPSALALGTARRVMLERQLPATFIEGFFEDAPVPGSYDAIIFSYHCYCFMPGSARRIAALRKAKAALKPGGHILVSYIHWTRPRAVFVTLARAMGALFRSDWRAEPGDMLWDNRAARPSYAYSHAFEPGDVEREAAAAGLRPVFSRETGDGRAIVLASA